MRVAVVDRNETQVRLKSSNPVKMAKESNYTVEITPFYVFHALLPIVAVLMGYVSSAFKRPIWFGGVIGTAASAALWLLFPHPWHWMILRVIAIGGFSLAAGILERCIARGLGRSAIIMTASMIISWAFFYFSPQVEPLHFLWALVGSTLVLTGLAVFAIPHRSA